MNPSGSQAIHFIVTGRVQDVGFRAATRQQARALQLSGWVCNGSDGRVEGLACGAPGKLEQLQRWLETGPEFARVDHLQCMPAPFEPGQDFVISPDMP